MPSERDKEKRWWSQFTISNIILITILASVSLGWIMHARHTHQLLEFFKAEYKQERGDRENYADLASQLEKELTQKEDKYYLVTRLIEAAQAYDSKVEETELIEAAERALLILEPSYFERSNDLNGNLRGLKVDIRCVKAEYAILKIKFSLNDVHE